MKKNRTVLVFTLVICVVSFCAPSIFGQVPQRGRRPMMQNQPRGNLNALDLTDEQKEQLKNLREDQKVVQEQFMDKMKNLHLNLSELRQDATVNALEIEKIQDTVFNLRIEQMKNAYQHQKEIKKIFTPEQLEKMSALRARAMPGRAALNRRVPHRGHMFPRNRFSRRGIMWHRR